MNKANQHRDTSCKTDSKVSGDRKGRNKSNVL